jgi:hypothetical protein
MAVTHDSTQEAADTLVRAAHARAYRYPESFAGFRATATWQVDGQAGEGAVVARHGPEVGLDVPERDEGGEWVERELRSIVGHRQATSYDRGDGRHAMRVAGDSGHRLGVLVEIDDDYASLYRVQGEELATVTRTVRDRRFTIVVHERRAMADGTGLPTSFTVFYWDAATGELAAAESYQDSAVDVDGVFLPASRSIVRGDGDGLSVRTLQLRDHVLLEEVDR